MMIIIGLVAYAAAWLYTARKIAYRMNVQDAGALGRHEPDYFMNAVIGFMGGLLWPLILPVLLIAASVPATPAMVKRQAQEQAARIAELERTIAEQARGEWDGKPL